MVDPHQTHETNPKKADVKQPPTKADGKVNPNFINPITKNYPGNAFRPLEISQATY